MTRMQWGAPERRFFETGLDRGVLYPKDVPPIGPIVATNFATNPRAITATSTVVEVKRNRTVTNPRDPAVAPNDTQWVVANNQTITGHPLGFTKGCSVRRDIAIKPTFTPEVLASVTNLDGLSANTGTARYVGAYVMATRTVLVTIQVGNSSSSVQRLQANKWYWLQTPSKSTGWASLEVKIETSGGAVSAADRVYISGVLSSNGKYSYFDGAQTTSRGLTYSWAGTAYASESVATGKLPKGFGTMGNSDVVQDLDAGEGVNIWANEGGGIAYTSATVGRVGYRHAASVIVRAIPGETPEGIMALRLLDGDSTIAKSIDIDLSEDLPADGRPLTVYALSTEAADTATGPLTLMIDTTFTANFHLSDILIQEVTDGQARPVTYFDGSTESGAFTLAWTGAPNDSTSTKRALVSLAVPWDGLSSVEETGGEAARAYFVDGRPFLFLPMPKEYKASLSAYTYPDEFSRMMGLSEVTDGMYLDSQAAQSFDMCYRTLVGNATDADKHGYKIHLVYNATVTPGNLSYESLGDSINPTTMTWEIQAVPRKIEGFRPTAHIVIDTRHMDPYKIQAIETLLYGGDDQVPVMPDPQVVFDTLHYGDGIIVRDNGDGTFEVEGSYENVFMLNEDEFRIENIDGQNNGDGTFTISTTAG